MGRTEAHGELQLHERKLRNCRICHLVVWCALEGCALLFSVASHAMQDLSEGDDSEAERLLPADTPDLGTTETRTVEAVRAQRGWLCYAFGSEVYCLCRVLRHPCAPDGPRAAVVSQGLFLRASSVLSFSFDNED